MACASELLLLWLSVRPEWLHRRNLSLILCFVTGCSLELPYEFHHGNLMGTTLMNSMLLAENLSLA